MYSHNEYQEKMNYLGSCKTPFTFVIPYGNGACHIETDSSAQHLYYQFPSAQRLCTPIPLPPHITWHPDFMPEQEYRRAFKLVQQHLQRGDTYLVNLCSATRIHTNLSLEQVFFHAQAPFKILVPGHFTCFSPEPFVTMEGDLISTHPMKGTAVGKNAADKLMSSEKEAREHATVVDLLRNDLALVAKQVEVRRYRYLESISTSRGELWATSSDICATLPPGWASSLGDILFTLLPAGSVTGAPKEWTCRIIDEVEKHPRGFYTGVFGHFNGVRLESAVSIRFLEQTGEGQLLFRSGGGVTLLSDVVEEYQELRHKTYLPFKP